MKKVVSVLMIMAVFSTVAFAAPLSVADSLDTLSREITRTELTTASLSEANDLFADVQAVSLTVEEAEAVEGEGICGILIGVVLLGAGIGAGAALIGINLLATVLP
jgi:hypothetical protein